VSTTTPAPANTSLSLLQEILKQLYVLAKPPPPSLALRPPPSQAQGDDKGKREDSSSSTSSTAQTPPEPDITVNLEKLNRIKEAYFGRGDSPELEEFLLMFLETLQICKHEYLALEGSIAEVVRTLKEQQAKANKKKKRKRKNLPEGSKNLLKKWLADHWVSAHVHDGDSLNENTMYYQLTPTSQAMLR
jgi:hypothetical protein